MFTFKIFPKYRYWYICKPKKSKYLMTIFEKREWLWKVDTTVRRFLGEGSVWYELPNMKRPGTMLESYLVCLFERYENRKLIEIENEE